LSIELSLLDPNTTAQSVDVTFADPGITVPKSVTFAVPVAHPAVERFVALGTVAVTTTVDVAAPALPAARSEATTAIAPAAHIAARNLTRAGVRGHAGGSDGSGMCRYRQESCKP
jgi:hypothetical protein